MWRFLDRRLNGPEHPKTVLLKLTDCVSNKEPSNNERRVCCSDFHKLERITRNVRSTGDTQTRLYQVSIFRAHQRIILKLLNNKKSRFTSSASPSPQIFCLIQWYTYQLEGHCFPFNSCASSLLPFLLKCEFPARFRRFFHRLLSAASYLSFASSLQKSLGFRRSWKKGIVFK